MWYNIHIDFEIIGRCTMRKLISGIMAVVIMFALLPIASHAENPAGLKWNGAPATLAEIAEKTGRDIVDSEGNYKHAYYEESLDLWEKSILKGSDGVLNLDKRFTREEAMTVIIRLLNKEEEALSSNFECKFQDVSKWARPYVAYASEKGIATGYSATKFGGKDPITANQYLTLVLRAMGYSDKEGDFVWKKAAEKAFEIKLIKASLKDQYMLSNLFLRDDVAHITYNALYISGKDGINLASKSTYHYASGDKPFATRADKIAAATQANNTTTANPSNTAITGFDYKEFAVADYKSVDPDTTVKEIVKKEDRLFLAYENPTFKKNEYIALLKDKGFSYKGSINFEPQNAVSVTGGIVTTTTRAWECDWYANGNLHVVFGNVGKAFIVRIYNGEVDEFSANGLRIFQALIKGDK